MKFFTMKIKINRYSFDVLFGMPLTYTAAHLILQALQGVFLFNKENRQDIF
jgi:RsiW-degrading membrane proteinase PrsW (M82 family)